VGNVFYMGAAIAIGACLSVQPPVNAVMVRTLGSPLLAACISIAISLIFIVLVWLTWGKGAGDLTQVRTLPWWILIGGVVGAVFVAGGVMFAPILGVALFFVCVVAGQLLGSTLADHFGVFGLQVKPVNMMKLLGLGLVLAGAVLVQNSST
jgi:transporter family-2 protein